MFKKLLATAAFTVASFAAQADIVTSDWTVTNPLFSTPATVHIEYHKNPNGSMNQLIDLLVQVEGFVVTENDVQIQGLGGLQRLYTTLAWAEINDRIIFIEVEGLPVFSGQGYYEIPLYMFNNGAVRIATPADVSGFTTSTVSAPLPAPVPLPGTLALFGLGMAGLGIRSLRKSESSK